MLTLRNSLLVVLALSIQLACRSTASALEEPVDVAYEIHAPRTSDGAVVVTMRVRASPEGGCTFDRVEEWGGAKDTQADIAEIRVVGADGREIPLEHLASTAWRVQARPDEPLAISWALPRNEHLASKAPSDHYRPVVTRELFHAIGNLAFLTPQSAQSSGPVSVRLGWIGFDELGWTTACSFGAGASVVVHRPIEEFRQAVFIAGKYTIHERDIRGHTLAIALPDSGLDGVPAEFADLCARIVTEQRAFFDDWEYPFYLISVLAVGVEDARSLSLGGTGLTDSFALFLQRGSDLNRESKISANVEHLLAHEMFHNWCGRWTPMMQPERLCYWFSEGFTEFFTRRLLFRAGLSTVERYTRELQQSVVEYHQNPRRNATAQELADDFWTDRVASEMPYRRGDLVAALVDHAIRTRTKGAQSLDDFMREAVKLGRAGEQVDAGVLLARIERWTDPAFAQRIRAIVIEGATIELPEDLFAPCLMIGTGETSTYELGFDFAATQRDKAMRGVKPDSAAWKAGLRDGQTLKSFSGTQGRADQSARVEVEIDGKKQTIEYWPSGPPLPVPVLRVASSTQCSCL